MGFYIYFFGPSIVGFLLGLILAIEHRGKSNDHYQIAKREFADLVSGRESELQSMSDEIIHIFLEHKFVVVERSDEEIVFKHPALCDVKVFWMVFWIVITLGGALGAMIAIQFFGRTEERVSVRLVAVS